MRRAEITFKCPCGLWQMIELVKEPQGGASGMSRCSKCGVGYVLIMDAPESAKKSLRNGQASLWGPDPCC